jgi:hypothetical protein
MDTLGDYASGDTGNGESGSGTICDSCRTHAISPGGIAAIVLLILTMISCAAIGAWWERNERMSMKIAPPMPVHQVKDVEMNSGAGPSTDHPSEKPAAAAETTPTETRITIETPQD